MVRSDRQTAQSQKVTWGVSMANISHVPLSFDLPYFPVEYLELLKVEVEKLVIRSIVLEPNELEKLAVKLLRESGII